MLILEPEHRGPTAPLDRPDVPPRRPGSVRRTSTIDIRWPDGFTGPLAVHARARDLRTGEGSADVVAACAITATVAPDRTLVAVDGPHPRLGGLAGTSTLRGFRSAVADALPDLEGGGTPLRLLLDDLPVALLVSGFALLAADAPLGPMGSAQLDAQVDVCAGWADGGGMVTHARAERRSPTPVPIPSPSLEDPGDPMAWHEAPMPQPIATRRRRLLDVSRRADGRLQVASLFRDSHVGPDGVERSFHEYAVTATADPDTGTLLDVDARPGVLPWRECPAALASTDRLVGAALTDVRAQVRASFRGTTTCTHLNDVLAGLGDVPALAAWLGC